VPFPYTNRPITQHRPALVVSTSMPAEAPHLLWVLMVTSATHRGWPDDVAVSNLAEAGLPSASVVRSAKIATIDAGDAAPIGRLPQSDRAQVARALSARLGPALERPASGRTPRLP
jgi:mRNA interferase MazF